MEHYIIVKFNAGLTDEQKTELTTSIRAMFSQVTGIPGLSDIRVFRNCIHNPKRSDLMIRMTMERDALELFDQSIWHKQWKEQFGPFLEAKTIFDCQSSEEDGVISQGQTR